MTAPAIIDDEAIGSWVLRDTRVRRRCSLIAQHPEGGPGLESRTCELCEEPVWYTAAQQPGPDGEAVYCVICCDIWQAVAEHVGRKVRVLNPAPVPVPQ